MKQLDPQIPSPIPDSQATAPLPLIPNAISFYSLKRVNHSVSELGEHQGH